MQDSAEQLELYRLLVENSLGLMCIHDLDGVLSFINPAAAHSLVVNCISQRKNASCLVV